MKHLELGEVKFEDTESTGLSWQAALTNLIQNTKKLTHTTRMYCNLQGINKGERHFNIILMQYNDYSMIKG